MRIDILTLFPQTFEGFLNQSIIGRARERNLVDIVLCDIRTYAHDRHHTADDYPYGGGAGMVLKPEPIFEALGVVKEQAGSISTLTVLLSPQGRLFNQQIAQELATYQQLILICGHYEGIDERVAEHAVDDEISIGDYVLSGGEVVAMVIVDAVARLLPGVLGSGISLMDDSHTDGLLEYPQYTRPSVYRGWSVPAVLCSGDHGEVARWRRQQSLLRTAKRRPDLLAKANLSKADQKIMSEANYC